MNTKSNQQSLEYEKFCISNRLIFFKPYNSKKTKSFAEEIRQSLGNASKSISPKFFYDQNGSQLFDAICQLPEYYLTRTEIKLLKNIKNDLAGILKNNFRLVELGSGSSIKTRLILDVFEKVQSEQEYVPIDISEILEESSKSLLNDYKNLQITGIIDTYEMGLEFLENYDTKNNLIAFLGSSFGNFEPNEGRFFLKQINSVMKDSDLFMVGVDMIKDRKILEDAYNDKKGITAQFNLNVLKRINQELYANFDLDSFSHYAVYNDEKHRIEMYLKSKTRQSVYIKKCNLAIKFEKDEMIHTENSHKYSLKSLEDLLCDTGFHINRVWNDKKLNYALVLARKN